MADPDAEFGVELIMKTIFGDVPQMIRPKLYPSVLLVFTLTAAFSCGADSADGEVKSPRDPAWEVTGGLFGHGDLLERARRHEKKGRPAKAAKTYLRMADMATQAKARTFARTRAGDRFVEAGKYTAARDAYREALTEAAGYIRYGHVLVQLRKLVGKFESGAGRWFGENLSSAIETLELILETSPLGEHAAADRLKLADLHRKNDDYEQATAAYRSLLHQYPRKPEAQDACFRLAQMLLKRGRLDDRDGSLHQEAKTLLKRYMAAAPESDEHRAEAEVLLEEIHEFEARRILEKARFYTWEIHWRPEAVRRYLSMLDEPPYDGTLAAARAEEIERELAAAAGSEADEAQADSDGGGAESGDDAGAGKTLQKWLLPIEPLR